MALVASLRYHLFDHICIVAQLLLQLVVTLFSLCFAVPIHVVSLITRKRAAARGPSKEVYFITGASSGIGAALAIRLASLPTTASIHLCGRDEERLEATRRACRGIASSNNLRLSVVVADVADGDLMRRSVLGADAAERAEGDGSPGLTCVVANAGVSAAACGFESARNVIDINMIGTVNTISPVLPLFVERRQGQVVIVSSVSAVFPGLPMLSAYGASKSAQKYYGEALRVGLEEQGVDVLTVLPWFVSTPMTKPLRRSGLSMLSTQSCAQEMVQAMQRRRCGTIFVPQQAKFLENVVNAMPVHQRALLFRLGGKSLNPRFTVNPG